MDYDTACLSLAAACERGIDPVIADYPFDDHGKSILMQAKYGCIKARASGKLIAAESVGRDACELIHSMAAAISLGACPADLLKVHWDASQRNLELSTGGTGRGGDFQKRGAFVPLEAKGSWRRDSSLQKTLY